MASVRKMGPSWQVRWKQPDGTDGTRGGFATKAAAQATQREIEDTVAAGRRWEPRDARPTADLREIAAAYVTDCVRKKSAHTVTSYARTIESFMTWLEAHRATLSAALLSRPVLLEYYDHLCATPATAGGHKLERPRAGSTCVKRLLELHRWWAWAYDADERWPGLITPPRDLGLTMPLSKRVVAPTWEEMDACVAASSGMQRRVAIVMRFTGLRVSQVMRLRWDDVDLDAAQLVIRPELGKTRNEKVGRTVPMSSHLVEQLAGWGVRQGWLVPSYRQPGPRERVFRSEDIRTAWERGGVRPEVFQGRPDHAFRKGIRSGLKKLGIDSEAIEYLLGHELGDGEQGTYTDPDALPLADAVAAIPPLTIPSLTMSDPAMDTRWIRAIANATDPEEKARLRAVPRVLDFADGGTRRALRRRGDKSSAG